ncbi:hypothetical protein HZH66_009630 [Vespula vulgaris]|uniref:Uncharacterized protein n=1 Tax=Vespula vulgaris TaxID=7454 RepID=A0A834JNC2_VESVU|nr:hypothetical protein HZH66_009630 [Vespula vulgaris]
MKRRSSASPNNAFRRDIVVITSTMCTHGRTQNTLHHPSKVIALVHVTSFVTSSKKRKYTRFEIETLKVDVISLELALNPRLISIDETIAAC